MSDRVTDSAAPHDCGHACCDERHDPLHDHFLSPADCPRCAVSSATCQRLIEGKPCGQPRLPGNPFCATCDLAVLIIAREFFPDAADADFEREVPRG